MNNFDKIKNMNSNDFAKWLDEFAMDGCRLCGQWNKNCHLECQKHYKEWLDKEVKNA